MCPEDVGTRRPPSSLRVAIVMRCAAPGQVSLERVFGELSKSMPNWVECVLVTLPRPSTSIIGFVLNACVIRSLDADVIHFGGDVTVFSPFVQRDRAVVTTFADLVPLHARSGLRRALIRLLWYVLPLRRSNICVAISQSTRSEARAAYGQKADDMRVVYCPAPRATPTTTDARSGVLHVGAAGHKNLRRTLRALEGTGIPVRVVGVPPADDVAYAEELGVPLTCGTVSESELFDLYRKSAALVFPSLYEGFGLPIVEAQASGCPVITSRGYSMQEVADRAAVYVDPYDVTDIRRAILQIVEDPDLARSLADLGRANVERFKPSVLADEYAELYFEAANAERGWRFRTRKQRWYWVAQRVQSGSEVRRSSHAPARRSTSSGPAPS